MNLGPWPFIFISLVYFGLWIYCMIDIIQSKFKDSNMKLIWILVILFAPLIGMLVYLALGKGTKTLSY